MKDSETWHIPANFMLCKKDAVQVIIHKGLNRSHDTAGQQTAPLRTISNGYNGKRNHYSQRKELGK